MYLTDLLTPAQVVAKAHVTSKKRLLELVADKLALDESAHADQSIFTALCQRERLGNTALGEGVAIPHGRVSDIEAAHGVLVQLAEPVNYDADDEIPVDLIFALAVPEHFVDEHLDVLSKLAELFRDERMREQLRAAEDRDALYTLISQWQEQHHG